MKYFALSKEDRALFPYNLIKTLQSPALNDNQRRVLDRNIEAVFKEIETRDAELKALESLNIDIDDVVGELERAREHVKIATETYREHK